MTDDPRTQPLKDWNRLARENAENEIVSSMFEILLATSEAIETFSTWLLVAAAGIASFLVTNVEKVAPFVQVSGFKALGAFLIASCVFGLVAKGFALWCRVGRESTPKTKEILVAHLTKHQEEQEKIRKGAEFWGITVETGIRLERVLQEFLKPAPFWIKLFTLRFLRKHQDNPQVGHLLALKTYNALGLFTFLQVLAFLGFLITGFILVRPL